MRRRALLWTLIGAVWAFLLSFWPRRVWDTLLELFKPRVDSALPPDKLSPAEMGAVLGFAEVLVAERTLSSAERAPLVDHINDRTLGTPGFLALYRHTAALLDRLTSRPFADLPRDERVALVERLRLADSHVRSLEYVRPFNREALLTRQHVVPDLIAAYYTSPVGWALVGYDISPGQCGDLVRYTREER
jgi:hypothetical protein